MIASESSEETDMVSAFITFICIFLYLSKTLKSLRAAKTASDPHTDMYKHAFHAFCFLLHAQILIKTSLCKSLKLRHTAIYRFWAQIIFPSLHACIRTKTIIITHV